MARSEYERTTQVIGLNVIYLRMFNSDSTKHVYARERETERERERERALVTVGGAYPSPS